MVKINGTDRTTQGIETDPNGLTFGTNEILDIFVGLDSTTEVFRVQVGDNSGTYQARGGVYTDSSAWTDGSWYDLTDGWNGVEIDFQAASMAGADDGYLTLWLDGVEKATLSSVDNDTYEIDSARLGAMGVDSGTSGSVYFDDFESKRFTYIGILEDPGIPDPEPTAQPSWLGATYSYTGDAPHAVTSVVREQDSGPDVTDSYVYDDNGNMTCREENNQVWKHEYNEENRLSVVKKMNGADCTTQGSATHTWTFTYDGDGVRVMEEYSGTGDSYTKYYFAGGAYEVIDDGSPSNTIKRYYSIAGMMVAMHDGGANPKYLAQDHLSSSSVVMDYNGGLLSQNRYMPFGAVRDNIASSPITQTDFGYTGQRNLGDIGLMDYRARFYSPVLGRFTQPDTIVPSPSNPQDFNRYSYVDNNPIVFIDPSGHRRTHPCAGRASCSSPRTRAASPNSQSRNMPVSCNVPVLSDFESLASGGYSCSYAGSSGTNSGGSAGGLTELIAGGGDASITALAMGSIEYVDSGEEILIYGARALREMGMHKPYVNNLGYTNFGNGGQFISPANGAYSSIGSPFTLGELALNVVLLNQEYQAGIIGSYEELEAEVISSGTSTMISAGVGGAVTVGLAPFIGPAAPFVGWGASLSVDAAYNKFAHDAVVESIVDYTTTTPVINPHPVPNITSFTGLTVDYSMHP